MMRPLLKAVSVICNNPHCFFMGNYHNTTLEEVVKHRQEFAKIIPLGDECTHTDVTYHEVDYDV